MVDSQVNSIFAKYDIDRDGFLSKTEARNFITDFFKNYSCDKMSVSDMALEKMIAIIDKKHDNLISKEELSKYMILFK